MSDPRNTRGQINAATLLLDGNTAFGGDKDINGVHVDGDGLISLTITGSATLGGLAFSKEDVVRFDPATGTAQMLFDGSDHFATEANLMAVHLGVPDVSVFPTPVNEAFVLSTTASETLYGVTVGPQDLLTHYTLDQFTELFFDGLAAFGATKDVNGVHLLASGEYLLTMRANGTLGGVAFTPDDVLSYDPVTDQATLVFEGTTLFGQTRTVNAIHQLTDGTLVLSIDNASATLGGLTFTHGDLVLFDPVSGSASLYLDGAAVFGQDKNINGIYIRESGELVLTVTNDAATLGGLTFSNGDIVAYDPVADDATLLFSESAFDGAANVDALFVVELVTPLDADGDGVPDDEDAFPLDPNESEDTDGDGVGDNGDAYPNDPAASASVTWTLDAAMAGDYTIAVRWAEGDNRSTTATYRIDINGTETAYTVDQTANGGDWVSLGSYTLDPADSVSVTLIDSGDGFVIADAVRLSWSGGVLPPEETQALYYVHNDHLGTPQAVTDANQVIRWQAQYAPFGEAEILIDDIEMPIRFPGQYFDEESGLHYNYFRDYDPSLGRYVQSDPIGLDSGLNTYGYVEGKPIQIFDFFGLEGTIAIENQSDDCGYTDCLVACRSEYEKRLDDSADILLRELDECEGVVRNPSDRGGGKGSWRTRKPIHDLNCPFAANTMSMARDDIARRRLEKCIKACTRVTNYGKWRGQ